MIKNIYGIFDNIKKIPDSFSDLHKTGKYIFMFWILHPIIDWMCSRINLGIHLNFRFYIIFFPVDISYHLGKIKLIKNDDHKE